MIGSTNLFIAHLLLLVSLCGIQGVDSSIEVVARRRGLITANPVYFKYFSAVVKAESVPTVYGCSYLSTNGTRDAQICRTKISNGELQALTVRNASDNSLRNYYPPNYPRPPVDNGTYWYVYEVPTSCWRNQELYGTTDGQNYTQLLEFNFPVSYPNMMGAPILRKAEFNETTKCMSVEIEAIENGTCANFVYTVSVVQTWSLQSDSCDSCGSRTGCCYEYPWLGAYFQLNGTVSTPVLNYEHCFDDNHPMNFIGMPNSTYNDTGRYAQFGLFRIKKNSISVSAQAVTGKLSGASSNSILAIELGKITSGSGDLLGSGKIIAIVSFLIIFVQGCVW